ncbi:hypothetical protein Taro_006556 [Colocasia esculenta]|uniref:Uncharacterized protein n=1 Tax=Colocasia esculenta TaxID=4460 RepID=A0A843TT14_COLES|nr:hypothetical protein [Colocasia esculenta]
MERKTIGGKSIEKYDHDIQKALFVSGPGCSSVGYGATEEIGPFLADSPRSDLKLNPYSWNKGKYVPELAELIYDMNSDPALHIDLKGFLLGNPETSDGHDWQGMTDYAWSHAVVSDQTHGSILKDCDFFSSNPWSNSCSAGVDEVLDQLHKIDIYSLYTPVCIKNSTGSPPTRRLLSRNSSKMMPWLMGGYDPCVDDTVTSFYNRIDVQKALHVNGGLTPKNWTICNMEIFNKWADSKPSVLPIYKKLIAGGLRIWVYSGDTDARVSVLSTRYCLNALGLPRVGPWKPWYHQQQVAGWVQEYKGLTYATFRGAGHAVPMFNPGASLVFFGSFLAGTSPPLEP